MATEISNGKKTVKLYSSVNRGKAMFQLSYYEGGKRVQRNFADKAEAKRVARSIVCDLAMDGEAVDKLSTPELESYVAARKVLASNYALHVAVAEHAQAVAKLGKSSLQEAVEFFLRHHRSDVGRVALDTLCEQFVASRAQSGFSAKYVTTCRRHLDLLLKGFRSDSLSDLSTEALDQWLGGVTKLGAVSKNNLIKTLITLGTWAEKRGHLVKGSSPFNGMIRYKEPNNRRFDL